MTKRDLKKLLQHVPQGIRLFVEIHGPSFLWLKTRFVVLRCSEACFPSDLHASGVTPLVLLDVALSKERAAEKAARYLLWLQSLNQRLG